MALAIRGTILSTATAGSPLTYATVKVALDIEAEPEWTAQTNGSGQFKIELTPEDIGRIFGDRRHRELVFKIYALSTSTTSTDSGVFLGCQTCFVSRSTLRGTNTVNLTASPSYTLIAGYPNFAVSGYVVDADGTPRTGVNVIVHKKNLRTETPLGSATTDSDGRFLVRYTGTAGGHEDGPEFSIRVATDGISVSATTDHVCNPPSDLAVRLTSDNATYRGRSDFELDYDTLHPLLDSATFHELTVEDVEFLMCRTELEGGIVATLARGHALAEATGLPAEAFYAFARSGLPLARNVLYGLTEAEVLAAIERAVDLGAVPASLVASATSIATTLATLRVDWMVPETTPESTTLGAILVAASLTLSQPRQFAVLYAAHTGTTEEFWTSLREHVNFGNIVVDRIQFTLQVGTLTANHPPLVKLLHAKRDANDFVHALELAQYSASDWEGFLAEEVDSAEVGTPLGAPGDGSAKRTNYAQAIARMVEDQFPTAHLAYRLPPASVTADIVAFVRQNPTFSLLRTRVETFFPSAVGLPPDPADQATLKRDLLKIQRVAAITPRFARTEASAGMLTAGITSARQIQAMGYPAFKAKMTAAGLAAHTDAVYAKADRVASATLHAFMHMRPEMHFPATGVITTPGCGDVDLENLFGSLDYCACKHCQSVYGPAAYFVDLMKFLGDRKIDLTHTQLHRLLDRRPELEHILLNCANSDTALPTIDLINEILERRARDIFLGMDPPNLDLQTTWRSADLVAHPEHIDTAVYDRLALPADAHFPLSLPFDLSLAETRSYLEALGLSRIGLQDSLEWWSGLGEDETFRVDERLGLSRGQGSLIRDEGGGTPAPKALWGIAIVGWIAEINKVETFLLHAGLDLLSLRTLLRGRFLPNVVIAYEKPCTLMNARLGKASEPEDDALGEPELRRLQVFLRVRRALGWPIADLDSTLAALGLTFADATGTAELATLARFVRNRRRFPRLPLGELLSWWSPLDRQVYEDGAESYYDQVVRPRTRESSFEVLDGTVALTNVQGSLQGILQVDAAGLAAAYQGTGLDPEVDNLNLVNLSKLYRVASIARAVGLSVPDLVTLTNYQQTLKEGAPGPFAGVPAAPVRTLLDLAAAVHDSGFTVPALDWVLRHEQPEKFGASDADVTRTLTSLITSLQQAHADHLQTLPPLELPQAERVALLLLGVLDAGAIPAAVDFILELTEPPPGNTGEAEDLRDTRLPFITEGDIGYVAFGQLFAGGETVADRIELLSSWFRQQRLERVVIQQLATPLGMEPADVEVLLSLYTGALSSLTADAFFATSSFDSKLDAVKQKGEGWPALFLQRADVTPRAFLYRDLRKVALVATTFRFSPGLLRWMLAHASDANVTILDLANLPGEFPTAPQIYEAYTGWDWLRRLIKLRDELLRDPTALLSILDLVFADAFDAGKTLTALANATGWDYDTLVAFVASHPVTQVELKALTGIEALRQAFRVSASLGADPTTTLTWAKLSTVTAAEATAIKGAIQGRFGAPTWPGIAQPIRDRLREQQRDALADLIVHRTGVKDREDLFGELLTDVDISCCGRTTRLLFATAAVQLFVQRALMGLEVDHQVILDDEDEDHWSAMKRYRVWEANRKIFLYPENWVTPELRDDKTPLFKRLEDEIGQSEADATSVEKAYIHYLEGLHEVAKLTIIGMYEEQDGAIRRVHVFARTAGQPSRVYYRRRIDESYWTPWEALPFPVEAMNVLPVVAFRRLMLIWPKITIHVVGPELSELTDPPTKVQVDDRQIRLMWAEYRDGEWGEVRTSEASTFDDRGPTNPDTRPGGRHPNWDIALTSQLSNDDRLEIRPVRCAPKANNNKIVSATVRHRHHFEYDARTGSFEIIDGTLVEESSFGYPNPYPTPFPAINWHQGFRLPDGLTPDNYLFIPVFFWLGTFPTPIINPHPGFDVLFPRQEHHLLAERPLVYSDNRRVFYIRKNHVDYPDAAANKTKVASRSAANLLPYFTFTDGKVSASGVANINAVGLALTAGDNAATQQQTDPSGTIDSDAHYRLQLLYHPFASLFLEQTRRYGVPGLLDPDVASNGAGGGLVNQAKVKTLDGDYFAGITGLYESIPDEDIDFAYGSAYSVYNWELFIHIPMYIADRLMTERRFAEAQRWLSYIFNPIRKPGTAGDTDCKHYWRIKPFHEAAAKMSIDDLLLLLHDDGEDGEDATTIARREDLEAQIEAWRNDPFKPHLIARMRPTAYMRAVVMKYLDNLIAWGDDLFRQDTRESTQESVQLYILALQILGKRPRRIDGDEHLDKTYAEVEADLDSFGNFLVDLENGLIGFGKNDYWQPLDLAAQANFQAQSPDDFQLMAVVPAIQAPLLLGEFKANVTKPKPHFNPLPLSSAPSGEPKDNAKTALYFCIPPNDKLLGYWDTVADRLFKLRNCLNLDGVRRDLALFDPPIDPALLAKAVAQGVDIATAISNLHAPLPHYRFLVHLGIAKEFAGQVSGLGGALLSALEKRDAEVLAVLRAGHERSLLDFTRSVREQGLKEAEDNLTALRLGRAVVVKRIDFYKSRERMNALEKAEVALTVVSAVLDVVGAGLVLGGSVAGAFPDGTFGAAGIASPVATLTYGGGSIGPPLGMAGQSLSLIAGATRTGAGILGTQASYTRRKEEWDFQQKLAETELPQLDRQITAAEIRVAMAKLELVNHDEQARQSSEALEVMQSKFSNAELYAWMAGEISKVYHHAYQLAVDMAKRTERCYQYELAVDSDFVQFGHWDNRRQGLLAGERLGHDLRRMEAAYYENNRREYELTKRISLASLDPVALIALRKTGACHFQLPSVLFSLDHASHFQRRIRLVGVTIPAVTGPYTNIGVNLTFEGGKIRKTNTLAVELEADGGTAQTQAISVAQEDAGLFEPNLRDERYLPFEGRGLEDSMWRLELPPKVRQFDYETISDIILTIRYTAREGGSVFGDEVHADVGEALSVLARADEGHGVGQVRIFSARAEFPEAWRSFVAAGLNGVDAVLPLDLSETRFPHPQLPPGSRTIEMVSIFVRWPIDSTVPSVDEFVDPTLKAPGEEPVIMDDFTVYKPTTPLPDGAGYNYLWRSTALYGGGKALGAWVFTVPDGWAAEVAPEDVYIVVQHKVS